MFKRKLNKYSLEIMCFLKKNIIKKQQKIIIEKLKNKEKLKYFQLSEKIFI